MTGRRIVALVGLPGSGKSTIGRRLARRFEIPFLDVDREVEREAGSSIAELFASAGEQRFRDIEEAVVSDLLSRGSGVLATGGGVVLRATNRESLRTGSTVVYLHCKPDQLGDRIRDDGRRPLLSGGDIAGKLKALYDARDALYRETAHHIVDGARQQFARSVELLQGAWEMRT